MTDLPEPSDVARAHSVRLVATIRAEIADNKGFVPFARYMALALYAPGLGYYAAGARKLGREGDFVTAPEMTPLFGRALANQVAAILASTARREIVELGGGSGRLAADLLETLAQCDALPSQYAILEPSPELRERQRNTLAASAYLDHVRWIDGLPESLSGALIANEVLDAIPVDIVTRREGDWLQLGVTWDPVRHAFAWSERPASDRQIALASARFPPTGDYTSEINPAAEALVAEIAKRLVDGAALFIDYGFPSAEYYHPQRSSGTLMCHYRHRVHDNPFLWPGLTDITAHVDFTAMAEAAEREGLEVAGFAALAPFLLGCGILEMLALKGTPESTPYIVAAAAVGKLLAPSEMGELFKVLALARSRTIDWPGFTLADRRHRL